MTDPLIRHEWATCVADHPERWAPEPMPKAWRDSAPIRQSVRLVNARRWEGLCWAWRVLRRTDPSRALDLAWWTWRVWGRLPQSREHAREHARSIMRGTHGQA